MAQTTTAAPRDAAADLPAASPSVRRAASEAGIDVTDLARRLGQETVSAADVARAARGTGGTATDPGASYWDVDHSAHGTVEAVPLSRFETLAAANLAAAQRHIPAVTHHDRADMSAIEVLRARLKPEAAARGVALTALAFHAKALARTLKAFPRVNASLSADGKTLFLKGSVHLGIAVDTPHGLMVPVVRDCDRKGLWTIAAEIADLAGRARERKVRPDEIGGASMSITNLGGIGGRAFTPIVNPPEVAILGITRATMEPVWDGEVFRPRPMCPLDLSYDHRVINGAEAARFLAHHAGLLADPRRLLL